MLFRLLLLGFWALPAAVFGQCEVAMDRIDEFDSTRMVVTVPQNIGYQIPSLFETEHGFLFIEEAKAAFSFTQNDTLDALFLTLAVPEHTFRPIETGRNVGLLLENGQVIWLMNFPDRGVFDKKTIMRIYTHTCALPLDVSYSLLYNAVVKIRIDYADFKHTITLLPEQQEALKDQLFCLGLRTGIFPVRP